MEFSTAVTLINSCADNKSGSELHVVRTAAQMICGNLSTTAAPLLSGPSRERVNVDATAQSLQYEGKSNGGCYEHAGIAEGLTKPVTALVDCFMLR